MMCSERYAHHQHDRRQCAFQTYALLSNITSTMGITRLYSKCIVVGRGQFCCVVEHLFAPSTVVVLWLMMFCSVVWEYQHVLPLVAGILLQRPRFDPKPVLMGLLVDRVALVQVFLQYFSFPCP